MSSLASEERFAVLPIFLLIDVSYSMSGEPIDEVNRSLPDLKEALRKDPTAGEIARIAVLTFSDSARRLLPLSDLKYADLPILAAEGGTDFAEAFKFARQEIEEAVRSLGKGAPFHTPIVFFVSDGQHNGPEDWIQPLRNLTDRTWKFRPEVVTFGFGEADDVELGKIATRFAFKAKDGPVAGQVKEIIKALIGSIKTTSSSLRSGEGGLMVQPNPNTFTPLPVQTV